MSNCEIIFNGSLQDRTGCLGAYIEIQPGDTLLDVHVQAINRFPVLRGLTYSIASESDFMHQNDLVREGQKIHFMPPFAGG